MNLQRWEIRDIDSLGDGVHDIAHLYLPILQRIDSQGHSAGPRDNLAAIGREQEASLNAKAGANMAWPA